MSSDRDERLTEIAACPACHTRPEWSPTSVRCPSCARTFARSETGVPILLLVDAPELDDVWYPGVLRLLPASLQRFAERNRRLRRQI